MSEFVIIAGLSGAGRSTAADTFDDLGWFVIDNMPAELIGKVGELVSRPGSETERVALVISRDVSNYADELKPALDQLRRDGSGVRMLYLEASDDVLVRRFEGTRRRHPLGSTSLTDGITRERALLEPVKADADVVVDTSELNVHRLRDRIIELFERSDPGAALRTSVVSFGYKHGIPRDVDMVIDCRFLPNPHWVEELRPFTGLDEPVRQYVLEQPATQLFIDKVDDLLQLLLPGFVKEGKAYFTLGIGCTGGQHRSVVIAEEIARCIEQHGFTPAVHHRDVGK